MEAVNLSILQQIYTGNAGNPHFFQKEGHGMDFPCPQIDLKMVLGY
jgi:hypothetical protein